jgi:putative membrane protein
MVRKLAIQWLSAFLAVLIASKFLPIFAGGNPTWVQAAVFAAILALLNTLVRPIITLITCPLTILSLGLFMLLINTFTFWLASYLAPDMAVKGFVEAFIGGLLVSIVAFIADRVLEGDKK